MRWCVVVALAVLQLCGPVLLSDPLLYIVQLEEGQENPSALYTEKMLQL